MAKTRTPKPPKKRNPVARALQSPLFRVKTLPNPKAYRRDKKVELPPEEPNEGE